MEKRASGDRDILFEVHSIICVRVRTTERYWRYVVEVNYLPLKRVVSSVRPRLFTFGHICCFGPSTDAPSHTSR